MADMSVIVIKHSQNDRELIRRTTQQLRKVNVNIVGAVLNAVDLKRLGLHDYYYTGYSYESRKVDVTETPRKKPRLSAQKRG
jgi:Mrp family chromosome partitioning ATPase